MQESRDVHGSRPKTQLIKSSLEIAGELDHATTPDCFVPDHRLLLLLIRSPSWSKWPLSKVDGGYCANNPTLYSIADATAALQVPRDKVRVVSLGVGVYPEPKRSL